MKDKNKLINVTDELTELQKNVLFQNGTRGIMIGGNCGEGLVFARKFKSNTMKTMNNPNEVFNRTGEFMHDGLGYLLVFRTT